MASVELEIDGLRRQYGSVIALDGLSFDVPSGRVLPVQLPLIIAYILSYTVIYANSANVFYHVLGLFPPTAPIAMPVLYASGDVPLWQVVIAAALLAVSTVWMARVAAGIYGRSILRTGARVKLREVLSR
ncbi:MAG: hypothetical protein ACXVW7_03750 [Trebonia sp.]